MSFWDSAYILKSWQMSSCCPAESFVRAIVQTWNREFGSTKVCFDVSMAVIAAVLSFVLAHRLDGVREGTVTLHF